MHARPDLLDPDLLDLAKLALFLEQLEKYLIKLALYLEQRHIYYKTLIIYHLYATKTLHVQICSTNNEPS